MTIPTSFYIAKSFAEGSSELTAFDNALLKAGMGNYNLLKVSSILPPNAARISKIDLPLGALIPTAYSHYTSQNVSEIISAGIAVGIPKIDNSKNGVIMELSGPMNKETTEDLLIRMIDEAMSNRNINRYDILIESVSHKVLKTGCVFAAIALV